MTNNQSRRKFITTTGTVLAGSMLATPAMSSIGNVFAGKKKRFAIVGTGHRAVGMWGKEVVKTYSDYVEFVGLCDINKGRVEHARQYIGVECPVFTDFEEMMKQVKPDTLLVCTVDGTHDYFMVRGMELGADIITEKPMITDEVKCQAVLDAEQRTGKKVTVTFNYRFSPHRAKMWELIQAGTIGKLTSIDFHWYLDVHHGADYFRRWHRLREKGGSLWVHKATHHFDLLNWWIDSDPVEVFAYGSLEHYGKNNPFRHTHCRPCPHKDKCKFYFDITKSKYLMDLYVANEQYDGYMRDGCVWKEDIDIFDKMAASIKYANGVQVSYSLVAYAPYEGYRIAFNGMEGRIDAWIKEKNPPVELDYDEIMITKNFQKPEFIRIPNTEGGHAGGDTRMKDKIFKEDKSDPFRQTAGARDGALSCLIGIAARKSCDTGLPVKIDGLTSLKPMMKKA